jgi:hypothetical protein
MQGSYALQAGLATFFAQCVYMSHLPVVAKNQTKTKTKTKTKNFHSPVIEAGSLSAS